MNDAQNSHFFALLVGINCYLPNRLSNGLYYKSLHGCVEDALLVEEFLRERLRVPESQIIKLTSSNGENAQPLEDRASWPTYQNIVDAFLRLGEMASSGDQVYIHYSGHGGRTPTTPAFHEIKGPDGIDEVLVPMDLGNSESRYLRDTELQQLIQNLVDKGLAVTIVLDSCHAGSATRVGNTLVDPEISGAAVRGIGEIDWTPRPTVSRVADDEELKRTWCRLAENTIRSAQIASGWLLEPKDYVLIAACRASEFANEFAFSEQQKNGALSYWLVDSLKRAAPGLTYKMLHDRILAKVHGQFIEQTPQLQGEGDRVVFETAQRQQKNAITVMKITSNEIIELNAGAAHNLSRGAQLCVYSLHETDLDRVDCGIAVVEIVDVDAATSRARILTKQRSDEIEPGCQAVLLEPGSARLRRDVRLAFGERGEGGERLAAELKALLDGRPDSFITLAEHDGPADYVLTINQEGEYVVCDAAGHAIPNLYPKLSVGQSGAAPRIIERLVHLSKYANILEVDNSYAQSSLNTKLLVDLIGTQTEYQVGEKPQPRPFAAAGHAHTLKEGEWTFLRIQNNHSQVFNITVLDLQPDWGIAQIYPARGAAFESLDPGHEIILPMRVSLPSGYDYGTDTIKVFATIEPTSFRWLELPPIDQPSPSDHVRGLPQNAIEQVLSLFAAPNVHNRQASVPVYSASEWTTRQVEIEIQRTQEALSSTSTA
jgi:hypothetical protein